jgi:hypothetical protein
VYGGTGCWSVLEALLRENLVWPPVALLVSVVVTLALLWRRTHPLAAVVAAFGVLTTVDVLRILANDENGLLWSIVGALVLPYALFNDWSPPSSMERRSRELVRSPPT